MISTVKSALTKVRWGLVIPLFVFAPMTVPVTAATAHDTVTGYMHVLDTIKHEGACPAGTQREGCDE